MTADGSSPVGAGVARSCVPGEERRCVSEPRDGTHSQGRPMWRRPSQNLNREHHRKKKFIENI